MQAPQTLESLIGRVLDDRYRIEEMIGVGGCGAVFRGRSIKLPKPVAIKVLLPDGDFARKDAQNRVRRFAQEARATSLLRHPNTIQVFDYGTTEEGLLYLVMELLDGFTLRTVRQSQNTLSVDRACHIAAQICDSLAEAHEHGIIHRDLKPDNVFLCNVHGDPDFVKVLDFGIAKMLEADTEHEDDAPQTKTGLISGTPRYMSPEQAMGEASDGRSDLYSLGVILFEAIVGQPPFTASTPVALLHKHLTEPPPAIGRGCPPDLETLIFELLAKEPNRRPTMATEVAKRLRRIRTQYLAPGIVTGEYDRIVSNANLTRIMIDPAMISHQSSLEVAAAPRPAKRRLVWLALAAALVAVVAAGATWGVLKLGDEGGSKQDHVANLASPAPSVANWVTTNAENVSQVSTTLEDSGSQPQANIDLGADGGGHDTHIGLQETTVAGATIEAGSTGGVQAMVGQSADITGGVALDTGDTSTPIAEPDSNLVAQNEAAFADVVADVSADEQSARLAVSSVPVGAEVVLNEVAVCETPCTVPVSDFLEPLRVEIRKSGHVPKVFVLGKNGQMTVEAAIEKGLVANLPPNGPESAQKGKKKPLGGGPVKKPDGGSNSPSKYADPW